MSKLSFNRGHCANCNSGSLDYGSSTLEGEGIAFEYQCEDCGHSGLEWYDLQYVQTT